jgi:hypothetical protein
MKNSDVVSFFEPILTTSRREKVPTSGARQGCQIFLGTTNQNEAKYTKRPKYIPNGHKIDQLAVK